MWRTKMRIPRRFLMSAALLGALGGPAMPCGFDSGLDGSFAAMHPKSLSVAFAISDAVEAGLVERTATAPIVPGNEGYWRAVGHVGGLHRAIAAVAADRPTVAISLVFIDSALWSRLTPGEKGFELEVHRAGPEPGDTVIVTSEAIVAMLLEGRMAIAAALDRNLIVVDGDQADIVRRLLVAGFAPGPQSDQRRQSIVPASLFGPRPHAGTGAAPGATAPKPADLEKAN